MNSPAITQDPPIIITPQIVDGFITPLADSLYTSKDIPSFFNNFTNKLVSPNKAPSSLPYEDCIMLASSVKHYAKTITSEKERELLINTKHKICSSLSMVNCRTIGRPKGILSALQKVLRNYCLKKPLFIRDANGIRIILFGKESVELQNQLYKIANETISLLLTEGFTICECEPLELVNLSPEIKDKILIPSESKILPIFQNCVEDYVSCPKSSGYQGIQVNFLSENNVFLEVQFFTHTMRGYIEHYLNHDDYKRKKYGPPLASYLDLEKIQLEGFMYYNGTILDDIGLTKNLHL